MLVLDYVNYNRLGTPVQIDGDDVYYSCNADMVSMSAVSGMSP